jgi:hypothetical protein
MSSKEIAPVCDKDEMPACRHSKEASLLPNSQ